MFGIFDQCTGVWTVFYRVGNFDYCRTPESINVRKLTLPGTTPGDMGVEFGGFEGGKPDFRPLRAPVGPGEVLEWSATGIEFPNPNFGVILRAATRAKSSEHLSYSNGQKFETGKNSVLHSEFSEPLTIQSNLMVSSCLSPSI